MNNYQRLIKYVRKEIAPVVDYGKDAALVGLDARLEAMDKLLGLSPDYTYCYIFDAICGKEEEPKGETCE